MSLTEIAERIAAYISGVWNAIWSYPIDWGNVLFWLVLAVIGFVLFVVIGVLSSRKTSK
jgi:hypothetical protein